MEGVYRVVVSTEKCQLYGHFVNNKSLSLGKIQRTGYPEITV